MNQVHYHAKKIQHSVNIDTCSQIVVKLSQGSMVVKGL